MQSNVSVFTDLHIGSYSLSSRVLLAPMAGVTDRPFRDLCRLHGAGLAASEMLSSNPLLFDTKKTRLRSDIRGEPTPRAVQIAGSEPHQMAVAARSNVARGAQLIDINLGCPAKKVCNKLAGSALLKDERLVARIFAAVVTAVSVPVTVKMRTGWDPEHRNGTRIARLAERAGIAALAVHGRTRACAYRNTAEYETVKKIKEIVSIPVFANGDITTPQQAQEILVATGADAVMVGRAAIGNPWIFRELNHYLDTGAEHAPPSVDEIADTVLQHLAALHAFYGERQGVRIARKHLHAYLQRLPNGKTFWKTINKIDSAQTQLQLTAAYFDRITIGKIAA